MNSLSAIIHGNWMRVGLCQCLVAVALETSASDASTLSAHAEKLDRQLRLQILPYWLRTSVDHERGGYVLADDLDGPRQPTEKQLVTQARMLWSFSHFHRKGLSDPSHNCLTAADHGYAFLRDHFRDLENGGYFWKTDLLGKPTNDRKMLYGESFVVYALVEYHRASANRQALQDALDLFRTVQLHCHDSRNGGWIEHCERNWQPVRLQDNRIEVELAGKKSANAHLHWMEALSELYEATRDPEVRRALEESLRINQRYFYPRKPGRSAFHREYDWRPVDGPQSQGLSYGHNVEFAWLMIRAEAVLGRQPSWRHFRAHLDHALAHGYDHELGGLYNRGSDDQPATDLNKVWWVQAELLAALTDGLRLRPNPDYEKALVKLLDFVERCQVEPRDGIWIDTVTREGRPKATGKAHSWKAAYHDGRAIVKFLEAYGWQKRPN